MTATEAGSALKVSSQTVSNWEQGYTRPHIRRAARIDEVYGLTRGMVAALLAGDTPPDDAVDPDAADLDNGSLVWTSRTAVNAVDRVRLLMDGDKVLAAPQGAAAESGVDVSGLPPEDIEWLNEQANFLRRRSGLTPEEPAQ